MAEAADKPPRRRPRPLRWALWVAAGVAAVVALVALALVVADTAPGRSALARYLAGIAPANGLQVRVGRIEGSIYGRMVLRDLELRDPQGAFLTSPAVTVDWRPLAFARNHLVVRELSSDLVRVLRRPALRAVPRDPDAPLLPSFDITVGRLDLRRIEVAPAAAGRAHTASLGGSIAIADGRAQVALRARAQPHDGVGGGDDLMVRIDAVPAANRLVADVRLSAPAGGLVDGMARLGGRPLDVRVSGAGDWARWSGRGVATLGAERLLDLGVAARSGRFELTGELRPALFTPPAVDRLLAPSVAVRGDVDVEGRRLDTNLRLTSQALDLTAIGLVDLGRSRFDDLRIEARLLRPEALLDDVRGRDTRLSLTLDGALSAPRVDYRLTAAALGFGEIRVEGLRAEGRFTVDPRRTVATIRATATRVVGVDEAVGGVLRNMRLEGDVVVTAEQIASDNLRLRSDRLDATLVFAASPRTGRWDAALKGSVNRYAAPGLGVVNLTTDARLVPSADGGLRVAGNVRIETVRIDNGAVADLLGGQAVAAASFERTPDGAFLVSNLRLRSPSLTVVDGRGRYAPDGAVSLAASARSERYGPIQLTVEGRADAPVVRVRAPRPNVGVPLTDIVVEVRPTPGGYRVQAAGASPYGPLDVEATLRPGPPMVVDVARASLAGLTLSGRVQQAPAGPFVGVLDVRAQAAIPRADDLGVGVDQDGHD
jgi:translocation and assembly module TamB